jgi:hypothetical protein
VDGDNVVCLTCAEGRKWSNSQCEVIGEPWWYWAILGVAGAGMCLVICSDCRFDHFLHLPMLVTKQIG